MENEYDPKIEAVLSDLLTMANETDSEIVVEPAYEGKAGRLAVIVQNIQENKFGIIGTNIEEFPDDPLCLFLFNDKLYNYGKMEGFERDDILRAFDGVLKKVSPGEFFKGLLNN